MLDGSCLQETKHLFVFLLASVNVELNCTNAHVSGQMLQKLTILLEQHTGPAEPGPSAKTGTYDSAGLA